MIMMTPLAKTRRRRHFIWMKQVFGNVAIATALIVSAGMVASAQNNSGNEFPTQVQQETPRVEQLPEATPLPEEDATPLPETAPESDDLPEAPEVVVPTPQPEAKAKDLTIYSEGDRKKLLDELFVDLERAPNPENANLVAEEIWAVFLQSRSASVDFLLLRGIKAQQLGDLKLARRMFNHVIRLQPEYAEGWSRSGRLAIDERDMSRAASDTTQSLILQPRHFYALWTLGNVLETIGKPDEAFEAYKEAARLYPQHKEINARLDYLRADVEGKAL